MEEKKIWIAHKNDAEEIQSIEEHLLGTARRAKKFADDFGCGDAAELSGLLHDIGKYSEKFQRRIRNPSSVSHVDHSTAGAKEVERMSKDYIPLGMVIAGHHSGLLDGGNLAVAMAGDGTYFGRMKTEIPNYSEWSRKAFSGLLEKKPGIIPGFARETSYNLSFFIRMIYSCLVDADYLDTEEFMRGGKIRRGEYDSREILLARFEKYVEGWLSEEKVPQTMAAENKNRELCNYRTKILRECMEKGEQFERGLYTLTVPTGGGKTTASMGFALKHLCRNDMKRIIYVIPYTSVIDQNAAVFGKILGDKNVVEHHSGILYDIKEEDEQEEGYRKALATENWDAPVIVTTAVQFFESLYANRSSKCRKLHNLANSVIIFDEAQTLPIPYLEPCIAAIAQLVKNYRATAVLCTATQPALEEHFRKYLSNSLIREICSENEKMFQVFERTAIENLELITQEHLEECISGQEQVLCIVNKRKTAQKIYENLSGEGVYCLTTLLCPADRKAQFTEIKKRLQEKKVCKVIATSLIEAGVDLDFPGVYRQEAGLDSLIQAAGRCNREGRRTAAESKVYSFRLEDEESKFLKQNIDALRATWRKYEKVNEPEAISYYFCFFRNLLGNENLDQKEIMRAWKQGIKGTLFPFKTVAEEFQLIENNMRTVYIPKSEAEELLEQIQCNQADKNTFRKLGQYGVNVYENHFQELWKNGCLEEIGRAVFVLRDSKQYREDTGLQMDVDTGFGILI